MVPLIKETCPNIYITSIFNYKFFIYELFYNKMVRMTKLVQKLCFIKHRQGHVVTVTTQVSYTLNRRPFVEIINLWSENQKYMFTRVP